MERLGRRITQDTRGDLPVIKYLNPGKGVRGSPAFKYLNPGKGVRGSPAIKYLNPL